VLGVNRLLAMAKDTGGLRPIAISKVFLWFISHSIVLQLRGPFQEHLSPHQFGVLTPKGYETIFLTSNPSSTYTLIRSWCKSTSKMFLISFFFIFFLENSKMLRDLWWTLSLLPRCFYDVHFSLYFQHG
jgi:hypothetical protein